MTFSERLIELREEKGYTQSEFADKVGVSVAMIYRYESDIDYPSMVKFSKMCDVLDITPAEFFDGVVLY